jgi:hypothetical protein
MTYGSLVFNEKEITKRVNGTKIFDRVYHIPVRLNSLEIDLDITNSTIAGQAALARASTQRHIVVDGEKQYLTTNEPNDFIIKDIFCAAATTDTGINISETPIYGATTITLPGGPADRIRSIIRPGTFVPRTTGTPGG